MRLSHNLLTGNRRWRGRAEHIKISTAVALVGLVVAGTNAGSTSDWQVAGIPDAAGLVMGRVIDGATNEPVSGARVMLSGSGRTEVRMTDELGRFVVFNLPASRYRVVAEKSGFAYGALGRRTGAASSAVPPPGVRDPTAQMLVLAAGERRGDIVIRLWKYGAIAGRVLDDRADPVVGASVQAWPRVFAGGRDAFTSALPRLGWTDDRGVYRIPSIVAGDYIVTVPSIAITTPSSFVLDRNLATWSMPVFRQWGLHRPDRTFESQFPRAGEDNAISAGEWMLSAMTVPALHTADAPGGMGYSTTFAPGVKSPADATVIRVDPGQTTDVPDIHLHEERTHVVSGTVAGPDGARPNTTLTLKRIEGRTEIDAAVAISGARGEFAFLAVPDGAYELQAIEWPQERGPTGIVLRDVPDSVMLLRFSTDPFSSAPTLHGARRLSVSGADVTGITVPLVRGARVSGFVRFVGDEAARPTPEQVKSLKLEIDRPDGLPIPVRGSTEMASNERGELRSIEMPPGLYLVRAPQPPVGWTLQSAMLGGQDVSLTPFELGAAPVTNLAVTFTDRPTEISGVVRTSQAAPAIVATVVAFPVNQAAWIDFGLFPRQLATARVATDGSFMIRGLPSGAYFLAAIDDAATAEWQSRAFFVAVARVAERIQLSEYEKRSVQLTLRNVR